MERLDNDKEKTQSVYLDLADLEEFKSYTKVAFVNDAFASLDRTGRGYITLVLKDCHANLIYARMFDVEDFDSCGIELDSIKRKPIKCSFKVQVWNGSMSLILINDSISVHTGEFDFESFIGRFDTNEEFILKYGKMLYGQDWVIPYKWKATSLTSVGAGRLNAFVHLFCSSLATLITTLEVDKKLQKDVLFYYFESMGIYFIYLADDDKFDVYGELGVLNYLSEIRNKYNEEQVAIITDTVTALCGMRNAKHLYANLIKNIVEMTKHNLDLVLTNSIITLGSSVTCGGDVLSKY